MDLSVLLDPLDLPRVTKVLDELGQPGRLATIYGWDLEVMSSLYEALAGYRPVTLADFVPAGTPPLTEVIHHGKNSLPAFSHFQKRFCLPEGGDGSALWGYNENPPLVMWFAGAGYYVTREWARGEVAVDYTRVPSAKPASWPDAVTKNERGFGPRIVYGSMIDVLRGLSKNVSVGRAKRVKDPAHPESAEWIDAWFVLCREDATNAGNG